VCRAVAALSDEERNLIAGIFADEKSLSEMLANGELLYGSVPTASRRKTLLLRRLEKLLAGKI
jgi:DNA-directed RNA polymerase specialized sigma subunit